jgi:hypothetical protein
VLRVAPPDDVPKLFYEIDMMKSEVAIHRLVREHTDVPIPEIVYELIKYAFIRVARGKSMSTGRSLVAQCKRILEGLG